MPADLRTARQRRGQYQADFSLLDDIALAVPDTGFQARVCQGLKSHSRLKVMSRLPCVGDIQLDVVGTVDGQKVDRRRSRCRKDGRIHRFGCLVGEYHRSSEEVLQFGFNRRDGMEKLVVGVNHKVLILIVFLDIGRLEDHPDIIGKGGD